MQHEYFIMVIKHVFMVAAITESRSRVKSPQLKFQIIITVSTYLYFIIDEQ